MDVFLQLVLVDLLHLNLKYMGCKWSKYSPVSCEVANCAVLRLGNVNSNTENKFLYIRLRISEHFHSRTLIFVLIPWLNIPEMICGVHFADLKEIQMLYTYPHKLCSMTRYWIGKVGKMYQLLQKQRLFLAQSKQTVRA
jgi:hypothetical protein